MPSRIRIISFGLALILVSACGARTVSTPFPTLTPSPTPEPEITTFIVDHTQSAVNYVATGALNIQLPGAFNVENSVLEFQPEGSGQRLKIDLSIDGNSVTAVNDLIRDALKSSLEVDKYPFAHFTGQSTQLVRLDGSTITCTAAGTLDLHGHTHQIDLPLTLTVKNGKLQGGGTIQIDLLDYGVNVPTAVMNSKVSFTAVVVALEAESTTF